MRPPLSLRLLLAALAVPAGLLADAPAAKPRLARESFVLVKQDHPFRPPPAPWPAEPAETGEAIVMMEPMVVTEELVPRAVVEMIEHHSRRLAAEKFTFTKGGTICRVSRLEFGAWPDQVGLKLLRVRW